MVRKDFSIGKRSRQAIHAVLAEAYGRGRYDTRETHEVKFMAFLPYLQAVGVKDLSGVTQRDFDAAALLLAKDVAAGRYAVSTAQNILSAANRVFEAIGVMVKVSPTKFVGRRRHIRQEVPSGLDAQVVASCLEALGAMQLLRPLAMVRLCREMGLRAREAVLADTVRMFRELESYSQVNVQEGTKGGRKLARWIPATTDVVAALQFAREQSPPGSRNLLAADETYIRFIRGEVKRSRPVLKKYGIKNYRDLRAAYFCSRYQEITAYPAPVIGGKNPDRQADAAAREIISAEAGHNRVDVVGAYIGGRR